MTCALEQARLAAAAGEVPVGAVLVGEGELLASAHNASVSLNDPTAHAEILVLRRAAALCRNYRLPGTTLYVTVEPCTMCVGAMIHARIEKLVFGAREPKAGAVVSQQRLLRKSVYNHQIRIVEGILSLQCRDLLQGFFRNKRGKRS